MTGLCKSAASMTFAIVLLCRTASSAELVDRIVAISAGSAITWSGALTDANCQAFLAGEVPIQIGLNESESMEKLRPAIERLSDQLILEKVRQRSPLATDEALESESVPATKWEALVAMYPSQDDFNKELARFGLDADVLRSRLAREQRIMTFVDYSLRPQIRVDTTQSTAYYQNEFLPQFKQQQPLEEAPTFDDVRF